jgi:hypothetical protein
MRLLPVACAGRAGPARIHHEVIVDTGLKPPHKACGAWPPDTGSTPPPDLMQIIEQVEM